MPFSDPKRVNSQIRVISSAMAALFIVAGLLHLFRLRSQVELFTRLDMPPGTIVLVGAVELLAAVMLLVPVTRPWGAAVLAFILMGAVMWHVMTGVQLGMLMVYFFPITAAVWLFVKTRPPSLRVEP